MCLHLRGNGVPLNSAVLRPYFLAVIEFMAPGLVQKDSDRGRPLLPGQIKLPRSSIRYFTRQQLNWTYKSATKASRKVPDNWEECGVNIAKAMAHCALTFNITKRCRLLNSDQTAAFYHPNGEKTLEACGSTDVRVIGKDDKRNITVVLTATHDGI